MPVIITLAPLLFPPFFTLVSKIYLRTRCLNVATDGMGKRMDEGKKKRKKKKRKKKAGSGSLSRELNFVAKVTIVG